MRIEKVSDNQIKITMSHVDMNERDLALSDVINCTDKARALLYELIEKAQIDFSFELTGEPLAIEVTSAGSDGYMLLITRVPFSDKSPVIGDTLNLLAQIASIAAETRKPMRKKVVSRSPRTAAPASTHCIYSFTEMDDVTRVCDRLYDIFAGDSLLAKMDSRYYLMLRNTQRENRPAMAKLEALLSEYGEKHPATELSAYYLKEHGEIILERYATLKLAGL